MTTHNVTMRPAHGNGYGLVAESDTAFTVLGRDFPNSSFRYVVREFKQIVTEAGVYGENIIVLSPVPTVIALHATGNERKRADMPMMVGDTIVIDEIEYIVTARLYNEPILIRK